MSKEKLTDIFLYEVIKSSLQNKAFLETCIEHLKYQYLPNQEFKKIFKFIFDYHRNNNDIPTIGNLSQHFMGNIEIQKILSKVCDIKKLDYKILLTQLETYIKQAMFIDSYEIIAERFNGDKKDEAYKIMLETSEEINNFTIIKDDIRFDEIFGGFKDRVKERITQSATDDVFNKKIPLGIDEIDNIMKGGLDRGDTVLFLAQSGVGKTKLLRWCGVSAARRGYNVLHIQAEGSKAEALRGYDSTWTGLKNGLIDESNFSSEQLQKFEKAINNIKSSGGEIYVHAYEQFTTPSLKEVRDLIINLEKEKGKLDVLILDYLELFNPGDGRKYSVEQERERRRMLGKLLKNIAIEFDIRVITATQASNIQLQQSEDPNFVMTRNHLSEFKNAAEPFSVFITLNQTSEEKRNNQMRLRIDKMRNYVSNNTVHIAQKYSQDRFYDRKRTLEEFYFPEEEVD